MANDDVIAHSAGDDEDAPCGIQFGAAAVPGDDVIAHSVEAPTDGVACGVQLGLTEEA